MILSSEDEEFIRFAKECMDRGHYAASAKITDAYNRCFSDRPNFKPRKNTNCGSCLRHMVGELYSSMAMALEQIEPSKDKNS